MTENKRRKPYVKPSMEVIKVETTSILAGSPDPYINDWVNGGSEDLDYDSEF